MEIVVLSWFVLQATDSPFLLGVFGSMRFGGHVFAPFYGVMADRQDRGRLLAGVRAMVGLLASLVLLLAFTGRLTVWPLLLIVGVKGVGRSSDNVTRQAVLADVVPGDRLMSGVALTRLATDISQIVGPLAGGILLSRLGVALAYAPVAGLHFISAFLAAGIRLSTAGQRSAPPSLWSNLREGASLAWRNRVLRAVLAMAFIVNFAAFPLTSGIMPLFARDVLHGGPTGLAALLGASAAGALAGAVLVTRLKSPRRPGRFMVLASIIWFLGLGAFSQSRDFALSMAILVGVGLAQSFTMVPLVMLLLRIVPESMRGRVMGLRSLAVYGLPIGLLAAGALASSLGAPASLAIAAFAGMTLTLLLAVALRGLWNTG